MENRGYIQKALINNENGDVCFQFSNDFYSETISRSEFEVHDLRIGDYISIAGKRIVAHDPTFRNKNNNILKLDNKK